eukprot:GFUD01043565.1.p1 GENE.GFUD01043565.1~~GFUD01043565.1.p1  ORF type:complete len:195 (+),score=54.03 GFUD01043565.1:57-641(+)
MAPKTVSKGEAVMQDKVDQIKLDYLSLVNGIKAENIKAAEDLEKKLRKDEEDFQARQELERREFESRMLREKEEFKQKQKQQLLILGKVIFKDLELECPVCWEEMKPPVHIWQCSQGHLVCELCKTRPEVRHCPTCRQEIVGRATMVEKIAAKIHPDKDNIVVTEVPDTTTSTAPCITVLPRLRLISGSPGPDG